MQFNIIAGTCRPEESSGTPSEGQNIYGFFSREVKEMAGQSINIFGCSIDFYFKFLEIETSSNPPTLTPTSNFDILVISIGHFPALYLILVPLEYILSVPSHSTYVIVYTDPLTDSPDIGHTVALLRFNERLYYYNDMATMGKTWV